jgi:Ras-related protein Rab-1A
LLVYDVSDRESFVNVSKWHEDVLESLSVEEAYFVLIGNKADLPESERKITFEEGKELADSKNMIFIETSARTSANIQELFSRVAEEFIIR